MFRSWVVLVARIAFGLFSLFLAANPFILLISPLQVAPHLIAMSAGTILLIDADRHLLHRLDMRGTYPTWSPDNRLLSFGIGSEIVVRDVGGTIRQHVAWGYEPAWSPDGEQIAFWMNYYGNSEIYIAVSMGKAVRLTNHFARDTAPTWSPDGRSIAFQSDRSGNMDIYSLALECLPESCEEHIVRLTDDAAVDYQPEWSPDGRDIAFFSTRGGTREVYLMAADGSNLRQVTDFHLCANATFLEWSPDGNRLVFSACQGDSMGLYAIEVNGGIPVLLVDGVGQISSRYSPDD